MQKRWSSSKPWGTVGTTGAGYLLMTSPTATVSREAMPVAQGNLLVPGMPIQVLEVQVRDDIWALMILEPVKMAASS